MNSVLALVTNEAAIEAARAGARMAGQFSPLNTALTSIAIGLLGLLLRYQYVNRKLTVEVNGEVRKEFIEEMHALRDQIGGLRDDNETLRGEVRTLRRENDSLRDEVRSLHGVIDGMRRENLTGHIAAQRVIADALPQTPEMDRALRTLGNIQGDRGA